MTPKMRDAMMQAYGEGAASAPVFTVNALVYQGYLSGRGLFCSRTSRYERFIGFRREQITSVGKRFCEEQKRLQNGGP
jgi:hypothetical protein